MDENLSRRDALKWVAATAVLGSSACKENPLAWAFTQISAPVPEHPWRRSQDRVWLGGAVWANPMEDWRMVDGGAECQSLGPNRSVHSLTHQITDPAAGFTMSVQISELQAVGEQTGAGFRIGVRSEINEYRSNCFALNGVNAGVARGFLFLGNAKGPLDPAADLKSIELQLSGVSNGDSVTLTLEARAVGSAASLGSVSQEVARESLLGNVALVSHFGGEGGGKKGAQKGSRHRFTNWRMSGAAFSVRPEQAFGPLLWSMYSLSDSRTTEGFVLKISALTAPMGSADSHHVELFVKHGKQWQPLGAASLDQDAWVASFRIPNWNAKTGVPYKLVYREKHRDGGETPHEWTGTIRANPEGRPLRMAALTCQNDYAFPYEPVALNVAKLDPDLVFFSGDQIYENHGGFGIIREPAEPAILNYLRKFYQFGWSFREVMRDRPTLCLPDDHDVFQGNIWGEGGVKMVKGDGGASSSGGYLQPARMVNAVHKTNVSHHPDAYDSAPCEQGISVYFGDMVYGGVGFAIIADRQWKSGPQRVNTGPGRADHVKDPDFDCFGLDKAGLVLLGERQERFLEKWAQDWRGHTLKALLSQTVFANLATHHGSFDGYLKADLDSGSWPQTPRNRALEILRPSMALHINGDQHLSSLAQYGAGKQRDGLWSFCTPAIAVGYPRWWRPDEMGIPHQNRPKHGLSNTGEFLDGFGNKIYVYAVGNPGSGKAPNRYDKAHEKGSGFGFITFDTLAKTYKVESFRFKVDAMDGSPSNQFPGWPVTIHQTENQGENRIG
jgi:hypothetical protein